MCGRYYVDDDLANEIKPLVQHMGDSLRITKSSDIYPSERATIISGTENELYAFDMKWGMPAFKKGQLLINARAETVTQKPTYADAVRKYRCVIPASGFYEWTKEKQKVTFANENKSPLYMAGCFKKINGIWNFVIITSEANNSVSPFHNRMPLIMAENEVNDWVMDESFSLKILSRPVTSILNNYMADSPRMK